MKRTLQLVIREITVFVMIFSGWLLYTLLSDRLYEPIRLPAEVLFYKMAYISVQSYFVLLLIRLSRHMIDRDGEER